MYRSICITCLLLLAAPQASAIDFGVGAKVGVNGVGVDLSVGLSKNVNLRVSASQIDLEDELDEYELWPVVALGINYAF